MSSYGSYSGYGGGGLGDLVNQFRSGSRTLSKEELEAEARRRGQRVVGSNAVSYTAGGHPITTPLSYMRPPDTLDPNIGKQNALLDAFLRDSDVLQGAADRQFERNNAEIDDYRRALTRGLGDIREGGQAALGEADRAMGAIGNTRDAALQNLLGMQDRFGQAIPGIMDRVHGTIDAQKGIAGQAAGEAGRFLGDIPDLQSHRMAAYERGEQSVDEYGRAIEEFKAGSWADAQAIADGIRSSFGDSITQARSTINPDGTPKTPAQAAADSLTMTREAQKQVTSVMSQYAGQIREGVAAMEGVKANLGLQTAGLRGEVANAAYQEATLKLSGIEALNAAGALMANAAGQELQAGALQGDLMSRQAEIAGMAEDARMGYQQMMNGWHEYRANVLNQLPLTSLQLELQGRTQLAQFVQQNPESHISWFEGLLGLYSAQSAASGTTGYGGGGGFSGGGTKQAAGAANTQGGLAGIGQGFTGGHGGFQSNPNPSTQGTAASRGWNQPPQAPASNNAPPNNLGAPINF